MLHRFVSARLGGLGLIFLAACGEPAISQTATSQSHQDESSGASGGLSWKASAGNKYFTRSGTQEFYVYLTAKGGKNLKQEKRAPLNISLVIDRSGSMAGDKMAFAKKAAKFVIDQMDSEDILSIVNYDDVVEVTSASRPVRNKALLKAEVDKLYDRGSTNLTGGLLEGYKQVKKTKNSRYVNRVLLLTDGLANVGITAPGQMKTLVHNKYMEDGIALSTFGVGADYNEDLLTMLAETGRANYYFIASADKIPDIFAKELQGLLSVTAQNAVAQITIPEELQCAKVYGYSYEVKNNKVVIQFNDLFSGEEKSVLVKFTAKEPVTSSVLFDCSLTYTDAFSFQNKKLQRTLRMDFTTDKELLVLHRNETVQEMVAMFEATEAFDEVLKHVDEGSYEQAKEKAAATAKRLQAAPQFNSSEVLQKQAAQISSYSEDIETVKSMRSEEKSIYQKSNKASNYDLKKGKK